jgi:hypothetical protein
MDDLQRNNLSKLRDSNSGAIPFVPFLPFVLFLPVRKHLEFGFPNQKSQIKNIFYLGQPMSNHPCQTPRMKSLKSRRQGEQK